MPASWVAEQSCSLVLLSFPLVVALFSILLENKKIMINHWIFLKRKRDIYVRDTQQTKWKQTNKQINFVVYFWYEVINLVYWLLEQAYGYIKTIVHNKWNITEVILGLCLVSIHLVKNQETFTLNCLNQNVNLNFFYMIWAGSQINLRQSKAQCMVTLEKQC